MLVRVLYRLILYEVSSGIHRDICPSSTAINFLIKFYASKRDAGAFFAVKRYDGKLISFFPGVYPALSLSTVTVDEERHSSRLHAYLEIRYILRYSNRNTDKALLGTGSMLRNFSSAC